MYLKEIKYYTLKTPPPIPAMQAPMDSKQSTATPKISKNPKFSKIYL